MTRVYICILTSSSLPEAVEVPHEVVVKANPIKCNNVWCKVEEFYYSAP